MATRTRSQQREEEAIPLSREESDQLLPRVLNEKVLEQNELEKLWQEATAKDRVYQGAKKAVEDQERRFPVNLGLKCSIEDCSADSGVLFY